MAAEKGQLRAFAATSSQTRRRLPTLAEVLARRTAAPVDLYCYYLFLQREGSEDSLDFWLDVQQHENLCRAYFKDIRRSGKSLRDEWPDYYREARERGSIYNRVNGINQRAGEEEKGFSQGHSEKDRERQPDAFRDEPRGSSQLSHGGRQVPTGGRPSWADGDEQARLTDFGPSSTGHGRTSGGPRFPGDPDFVGGAAQRAERKSMLAKRASHAPTVISRNAAITRTDLIASAERIYARYLLPGSEKEIYLPSALRITSFPISSQALPHPGSPQYEEESRALARVPDMFHQQKEYVFRTMEADVFPRFLRAKAFGNLTPISALVRLSLGLLALWAGLATGFSFIFLDQDRQKRLWVILPYTIAILLIVSHQYELDPILVLLGQSETTPFHTIRIREPYVRRLLLQRAAGVVLLVALITAALTVLFVFVPGHRL